MRDPIVDRIARDAGVPDLVDVLADRLAPTDLQSVLIAVARRRADGTSPADVLRRYQEDRFSRPANVSPEALRAVEAIAFEELPAGFERIELSPVCPLGTSAALGGVSQDRILTTTRGTEVMSDPTSVLALECALRRRTDRSRPVRLAASQRVLRTPPVEPPLTQHFHLFVLCSAGRREDEDAFLAEHLRFYERLLDRAARGAVEADPTPRKQTYYSGKAFGITVAGLEVVEGGFVDWTARLLGDRKERLLTSGIGLELLARSAPR
ncbi:MAG: hypothetical protein QOF43_2475 [Gaiellaceae bacterium]|nr:hypothetical protein [Gaiellaceae bacterium]